MVNKAIQNQGIKSVINVPCKSLSAFFYFWLMFINPIWKATPSMIMLAAEILKHRFNLRNSIKDDDILNKHILEDKVIRKQIMDACKMSYGSYNVALGNLRKSVFFDTKTKINPKFIPKLSDEDIKNGEYDLLICFLLSNEKQK